MTYPLQILNDPPKCRKLKFELVITVDSMVSFICAIYHLEGDGMLALNACRQISQLQSSITCDDYSNINAVAKQESGGNATHKQKLVDYAKSCVRPAHEYFQAKFDARTRDLRESLMAFKAA